MIGMASDPIASLQASDNVLVRQEGKGREPEFEERLEQERLEHCFRSLTRCSHRQPIQTPQISTIVSICNLVLLVLSSLYSASCAIVISKFLLLPYFQAYQVRQSFLGHRHFPRENSQIFYVNILTKLQKSNAFKISLAEETKFS